jgi:hypothetical protein
MPDEDMLSSINSSPLARLPGQKTRVMSLGVRSETSNLLEVM